MKKFSETLKYSRPYFSDLLLIVGIVTALSVSGYFMSRADVKYAVNHMNTWYDADSILRDFTKHDLKTLLDLYINLKSQRVVVGKRKYEFSRDNPIDLSKPIPIRDMGLGEQISELKDALKYKFREISGDYDKPAPAWINNRAFWETTFPDTLSGLFDSAILDSVSFYNAIKIILAHREITVMLSVRNVGSLIAKHVRILLKRPYLLNPRSLMSMSKVDFLRIEPHAHETEMGDGYVKIKIDYLKPDNDVFFWITTSLTNITMRNIVVDYDTDKTLKLGRILWTFAIVLVAYYLIPIIISVFRKIES